MAKKSRTRFSPGEGNRESPLHVLIIMGHPRTDSFCAALADAYLAGATEAGVETEKLVLSDLEFEPNVVHLSPTQQNIEHGIQSALELIKWADHLVFVFPTWWGSMPALMKAFLDRVLMPGFAFEDRADGEGWNKLLTGKTGHLLTTMDTPPFVYRWIYGSPGLNGLALATLGFCGIEPVKRTIFGPIKDSKPEQRQKWLQEAHRAGERLRGGVLNSGERFWHRTKAWFAALRLKFHPMVWGAFGLGTVSAQYLHATFDAALFWLGLFCLFALEAATVFINELVDWKSDQLNIHAGPFTGGSRVLVEGRLSRQDLRLGSGIALGAAAGAVVPMSGASSISLGMLGILAVLAIGYTAPPLKLCWRGLGEIDVALTHSILVILFAHALQGGSIGDGLPWLLSMPLFFAVFGAITLAGIPDHDADRAAGKRTLSVILGPQTAARMAQGAALLAALLTLAFTLATDFSDLFLWLALPVVPHAAYLVVELERYRQRHLPPRRIDRLMVLSLVYIVWFVGVPLWWLMSRAG